MESLPFRNNRFSLQRITRSIENPRYLVKWFLMSTLIGIVAGLGAIAFFAAIHFANTLFLSGLVGYTPPIHPGKVQTVSCHSGVLLVPGSYL